MEKKKDPILKEYIIGNSVPVAKVSRIKKKAPILPDIYRDALILSFGLDGAEPVSNKEIARVFKEKYDIPVNESHIDLILHDALYMVNYKHSVFDEVPLFDDIPLDKTSGNPTKKDKLTWKMVIKILDSFTEDEDLTDFLSRRYAGKDIVSVPKIEDLFFVKDYTFGETGSEPEILETEYIWDIRGISEYILNHMEKMGILLVSDAFETGIIKPEDIYKYAYLPKKFAKRIIYDNPISYIAKINNLKN